jgi:hypothetical protein
MSKAIHRAPLAVASDGAVIVNLHHVNGDNDPERLLVLARDLGAVVFIGIIAAKFEQNLASQRLDDAATGIAAEIIGRRTHRSSRP